MRKGVRFMETHLRWGKRIRSDMEGNVVEEGKLPQLFCIKFGCNIRNLGGIFNSVESQLVVPGSTLRSVSVLH